MPLRIPLPVASPSFRLVATLLLLALLLSTASARNFTLRDDIAGDKWFDAFRWWAYNSPTGGIADYLSQSEARARNLSYIDGNGRFVMRADDSSIVQAPAGRGSVRIHSRKTVKDGVIIAKVSRMPTGCGTWPAFWTCTRDQWPEGGEIDIIEGANDQGPRNLASLHTLEGCSIPSGSTNLSSGISSQTDCSYQPGCSSSFTRDNSFGLALNGNGGGYFAMVRDTSAGGDGISVYFWPSTASSLPAAVSSPSGSSPPPFLLTGRNQSTTERNLWGLPAVHFPSTLNGTSRSAVPSNATSPATCAMDRFFSDHEIIFNIELCGYWAGGEAFGYARSCSAAKAANQSCEQFVRANPAAFSDARWEIDYLRVYSDPADSGFSLRVDGARRKRVAATLVASLVASAVMLVL